MQTPSPAAFPPCPVTLPPPLVQTHLLHRPTLQLPIRSSSRVHPKYFTYPTPFQPAHLHKSLHACLVPLFCPPTTTHTHHHTTLHDATPQPRIPSFPQSLPLNTYMRPPSQGTHASYTNSPPPSFKTHLLVYTQRAALTAIAR